jgi:hypothetical protein
LEKLEKLEERLARLEEAVTDGLALLAVGRVDEARELLAGCLAPRPAPIAAERISDHELERAFADAEPEIDRMRNADEVAHAAILHVDGTLAGGEAVAPEAVAQDPIAENFATETMAGLLETQGDADGAARIRSALAEGEPGRPRRRDVVGTLERWLENLRGGDRA